jgi:hypothetical protein
VALCVATALTFCCLLVHGYHPYAEDGGVYLPEIKRLIDPGLYPYGTEFVAGHLRFSLFAPAMAELVRVSHLSLESLLLAAYLVTLWATLFAGWLLAVRCYRSNAARWGAVGLLAVWVTMPIAGTSLMLMDPYLTARSVSTPCVLLALLGMLDLRLPEFAGGSDFISRRRRGAMLCFAGIAGAVAMHPLMGAYGLAAVLVLGVVLSRSRVVRVWGTAGLMLTALATAGGLVLSAPMESDLYKTAVLTRKYWFLSQWHWYEWIGLFAPLLILGAIVWRNRNAALTPRVGLARMAMVAGCGAVAVATLFAQAAMATHLVARMQPLRLFQLVYIVMILLLGAALGERLLRRDRLRWWMTFLVLAGVMVATERRTFPASSRIEWPGGLSKSRARYDRNQWERAFAWIRINTPKDAVFALDADYISSPGEDAQSFRAIAERSVLPDFSKDGGVVTNKPELAEAWAKGQVAQTGLEIETDTERAAALRPLGVSWVVLDRNAVTQFGCDYENAAVKVCRLP